VPMSRGRMPFSISGLILAVGSGLDRLGRARWIGSSSLPGWLASELGMEASRTPFECSQNQGCAYPSKLEALGEQVRIQDCQQDE